MSWFSRLSDTWPGCSAAFEDKRYPISRNTDFERRLSWHSRLHVSNLAASRLESSYVTLGGQETVLEPLHPLTRSRRGLVGQEAFRPPARLPTGWVGVSIVGLPIALSSFAPYTGTTSAFADLGLPQDFGSNGLISVPISGKTLIASSLNLLAFIAMPSALTWLQLRHPLNRTVFLNRPSAEEVQICRITGSGRTEYTQRELDCLSFWLEDERCSSLWTAIEGIDRPGWTLQLPDRQEVFEFGIDAYMQGDLLVVMRFIMPFETPFWPRNVQRISFRSRRMGGVKPGADGTTDLT